MLGVFPTEDLSLVPAAVVRFAAKQLDVEQDEFASYGARRRSRYEHSPTSWSSRTLPTSRAPVQYGFRMQDAEL
ncbi:DUF4158 domain-containing protein [Streptomyces sp. NPDC014894]|uniref:DUF4158 domain-containing protein n=1 Tax=Streptomyces sp. NPDC014894 TaxID=3364931 RepID=UPI0036F6C02C